MAIFVFTILPGFLLQPVNVGSFYPFLLNVHGFFHVLFNIFCLGCTEIFMYLSHLLLKVHRIFMHLSHLLIKVH